MCSHTIQIKDSEVIVHNRPYSKLVISSNSGKVYLSDDEAMELAQILDVAVRERNEIKEEG